MRNSSNFHSQSNQLCSAVFDKVSAAIKVQKRSHYRTPAQKKLDVQQEAALAGIRAAESDAIRYESVLDIIERWKPESAEYKEGLQLLRERKYRRAVDSLERLMMQRLLELTKLGQSGLGQLSIILLRIVL